MADEGDLRFARNAPEGALLVAWHKSLENDTGGRAELRRVAESSDAVFVPAFHRLRADLEKAVPRIELLRFDRIERLAAIACVTAHVREDVEDRSLGSQLARTNDGRSKSRVSPARFRRLLEADRSTELALQLRRIVALLDGRMDLVALADAIYRWRVARTRQVLAYDYYRVAPLDAENATRMKPVKGARA